jgi:hypothetical protein
MAEVFGSITASIPQSNAIATDIVKFTQDPVDAGDTLIAALIITGSSTRTLYSVQIDASSSNVDVYLKLWFSASLPTLGTSGADMILRASAEKKVQYSFSSPGIVWVNNVYGAFTTSAAKASVTGPSATVSAQILASA